LEGIKNPFSQQSNDSLYDFNLEEETFNNTKNAWIKYFATQAKEAVKSNQRAKTAKLIKIIKLRVIIKNLFINLGDYEIIEEFKYVLETKTETAIKPRLVVGIKTPLNTMSIVLQNGRESN